MVRFGWGRAAVSALLSAALVAVAPVPAHAANVSFTGQLSVNDIVTFPAAQVSVLPEGGTSDTVFTQQDGTFAFSGIPEGNATLVSTVNDPTWGNVSWNRPVVLHEGDFFALAPNIDYLQLYLIGADGKPSNGTAQLSCGGSQAGDVNTFTSTIVTRSGFDVITIPGYAADGSTCDLTVTWPDMSGTTKSVALQKEVSTSYTLLKNGTLLPGAKEDSNDDDGVADATEAFADNVGDGNLDGTKDYDQADVASLPENGGPRGSGEDYLSVDSPAGSFLVDVATADVTAPPAGKVLPEGLVDFTAAKPGLVAGDEFTAVIHVPSTAGMTGYAVLDDPDSPTPTWTQMPSTDVAFTPTTITLTLIDNGPFDRDPLAGKVRLPGGGTKLEIDVTAPTITLKGPADGATYTLGKVPAPQCSAKDLGGAGVDTNGCEVTVTGANSAGVGRLKLVATATDKAGNQATRRISYSVVYKPVDLASPTAGRKQKVYAQGSTVVVRIKLANAFGKVVRPAQAPTFKARAKGTAQSDTNQPVNGIKPDRGSKLVKRGKFWEFRWGTARAKAGRAYVLTVRLDDGTTRRVRIGIG